MKNYVSSGGMVTVAAAPTGGVISGAGYVVGQLFGVVAKSVDQTLPFEILTEGVFDLPKQADASEAWAAGALIYWDVANGEATTVASLNLLIGVAVADADHDAATGRVRLNGHALPQNTT